MYKSVVHWSTSVTSLTFQPITEQVQPHARQPPVVLAQHVLDRLEAAMQLVEEPLQAGVVGPLRHHVHVVEGEVLELRAQEVVLAGLARHDVGELQAVADTRGAVQAHAQQAQEQDDHHHLNRHAKEGKSVEPRILSKESKARCFWDVKKVLK